MIRTLLALVAFVILGLLPHPSVAQGDTAQVCTGDLALLRAEIEERRNQVVQSCAPPVTLMQSLLDAKRRYSIALVSASEFRRAKGTRIFVEDLIPLQDLAKVHQQIALEAAAARVLLDAKTAALVEARRAGNSNAASMFGVPVAAMSFDPQEIQAANALRQRHDRNYVAMEEIATDHASRALQQIVKVNAELELRRTELTDLGNVHVRLQADLRRMFDSRDFEHCLGEPAPGDGGLAQSVASGGFRGIDFDAVGPDPDGVLFTQIPGVLPEAVGLNEALAALAQLPNPPPPVRLPDELAFKRDGVRIAGDFAEVKALQDEANRQLANAALLDATVGNFLRTPGYLASLGGKMVSGAAQAIYQPFVRNFTDKSQGIISATFNSLTDIGFETVEGVAKSAANLIGDAADFISPNGLLVQRETEEANRSARENNLFRAAMTVGSSFLSDTGASLGVPDQLVDDLGNPIQTPGANATPEQVAAFIKATERREQVFADAIALAKEREKAAAILEGRAFDALNVLGAKGSLAGVARTGGKIVRGVNNTVRDIKTNLKIADTLDQIERLRNTRQSPDVLQEINALRDALKLRQQARQPGGPTREVINAALQRAEDANIGQQIIDQSVQNLLDRQTRQVNANRPFKQKQAVFGEQGAVVPVGQKLGTGGIKEVFDGERPDIVVQRFKTEGDGAVLRDIEAGKRLRDLGIRTTDDIPIKDQFGDTVLDADGNPVLVIFDEQGRAIKQSERIDGSREVEIIAKNNQDGRLSEEQFAASVEAANKAVENRHVLIDFKPPNIGLQLDNGGRLEVNAFDRDGVINLDEVIQNRRNNPALIEEGGTAEIIDLFGEKFDLSTVEGARKLQSIIIDGVLPCCPVAAQITTFTDAITPFALFQKLDTPGFRAAGTKGATFDGIRPLQDGKPRSFFDADADDVARTLDEARDSRILQEARPQVRGTADEAAVRQAETIIAASKLIRDEARTVQDLARRADAIKAATRAGNTLSNSTSGDDPDGLRSTARNGGGGGGGKSEKLAAPDIPDTLLSTLLDETDAQRRTRLAQQAGAAAAERQANRDIIRSGVADDAPDDGFPEGK
ncbi:MAG: hypothetical protein P1U65_17945 [Minwuia sp.]|nr:hypothetical protein [Minwuia sp.]